MNEPQEVWVIERSTLTDRWDVDRIEFDEDRAKSLAFFLNGSLDGFYRARRYIPAPPDHLDEEWSA